MTLAYMNMKSFILKLKTFSQLIISFIQALVQS